ncbi:sulfatase-like hydrolase/transferase [Pelagicoccus sp. SDUM812005]|uniref:sulfatase family protein n=1 Tax=Pelagicoccus sp. SDUM812005 TaxID=3041257 RepID=UPI0028101206|nr:sulfatase-like hydrolase/transferase [Pelagicoccus sp. SDUM812005]MDQ8180239.1 sulfatase-like hydrolase/transferase [Pelagicoccus sp. SDUM812005]
MTLASVASGEPPQRGPNIIFIFADDWGYGDLSSHGSSFVQTPHLDRMAAEGVDFANFSVNSPVCTPSRVAVMTGQFPARQSIHQHFQSVKAHIGRGMPDWLDTQAPSLPRMLQGAGYKTGHFGKWHLGSVSDSPTEDEYGYDRFATFNGSGKVPIGKGGLASVDHAERFIRDFKDEPFFVNLWLHEVHTPHLPQERFMEKFKHLGEAEQVYASVIAEGDEAVGRILSLLKELNIDEKTLVVFSTDNGPERSTDDKGHKGQGLGKFYSIGETGGLKGEKRSLFAGGVRVPFIVRWPGVVPQGKVDTSSVLTAVDLLPTFLEAAGVELPEGYEPDGQSVLAAFKGKTFSRRKPIFWEWRGGDNQDYTWPSLGIRDGKWKLLLNQETGAQELYDLESDWAEREELSARYPEVAQKLKAKLMDWKASLPEKPSENALSKARSKVKR